MSEFHHISVFKNRLVERLNLKAGDGAIDCTAGAGGHTRLLLNVCGKTGKVFALDQDQDALNFIRETLFRPISEGNLCVFHSKFSALAAIADQLAKTHPIKGICADLGVSSPQLDHAHRGFSFRADAPLDMRMNALDPNTPTAAEILASISFEELCRLLRDYGEEARYHHLSQAILRSREKQPITTTKQLSQICEQTLGTHIKGQRKRIHPATKCFQALRMRVNNELEELAALLELAPHLLSAGGRLAIISFHSLEDRLIKQKFIQLSGKESKDPIVAKLPIIDKKQESSPWKIIKPFPETPSPEELSQNPRSRSAKLRIIERIS